MEELSQTVYGLESENETLKTNMNFLEQQYQTQITQLEIQLQNQAFKESMTAVDTSTTNIDVQEDSDEKDQEIDELKELVTELTGEINSLREELEITKNNQSMDELEKIQLRKDIQDLLTKLDSQGNNLYELQIETQQVSLEIFILIN
jgi:hypothetical protein